ncbi:hypothetical protein [Mycolicibacterium sp. S3B2]|uniref:hypothetical protein n=1 Tax=Mycolicibacterium sp. S3B2 TaxID=3415120 RepID=UPI003C7A6346
MTVYSSKYTIELWTKHGDRLADLAGRVKRRVLTLSRNEPDTLEFEMDLDEFEKYCADLNVDSKDILKTGSTEVRIKRLNTYMSGGQLVYRDPVLTPNGNTVTCHVWGFLALFAKRRTGFADDAETELVSEVYTQAEGTWLSRTDLAWSLINKSQNLTNGDFGITRGLTGGSATLYEKTYNRTNIKDALQAMTKLKTEPIDIEFTYDKVFNTYEYRGSNKPEIVFEYPGNIIGLGAPEDATDITNAVIGIGRGQRDGTQEERYAVDLASQTDYELRQDLLQTNGTDDSDGGITDAAEAEKEAKRVPITIPALQVDGNVAPYVTDYGIGDRVTVKVTGYPLLSDINGTYRIEKMTVTIDENDSETVTLEVSKP